MNLKFAMLTLLLKVRSTAEYIRYFTFAMSTTEASKSKVPIVAIVDFQIRTQTVRGGEENGVSKPFRTCRTLRNSRLTFVFKKQGLDQTNQNLMGHDDDNIYELYYKRYQEFLLRAKII